MEQWCCRLRRHEVHRTWASVTFLLLLLGAFRDASGLRLADQDEQQDHPDNEGDWHMNHDYNDFDELTDCDQHEEDSEDEAADEENRGGHGGYADYETGTQRPINIHLVLKGNHDEHEDNMEHHDGHHDDPEPGHHDDPEPGHDAQNLHADDHQEAVHSLQERGDYSPQRSGHSDHHDSDQRYDNYRDNVRDSHSHGDGHDRDNWHDHDDHHEEPHHHYRPDPDREFKYGLPGIAGGPCSEGPREGCGRGASLRQGGMDGRRRSRRRFRRRRAGGSADLEPMEVPIQEMRQSSIPSPSLLLSSSTFGRPGPELHVPSLLAASSSSERLSHQAKEEHPPADLHEGATENLAKTLGIGFDTGRGLEYHNTDAAPEPLPLPSAATPAGPGSKLSSLVEVPEEPEHNASELQRGVHATLTRTRGGLFLVNEAEKADPTISEQKGLKVNSLQQETSDQDPDDGSSSDYAAGGHATDSDETADDAANITHLANKGSFLEQQYPGDGIEYSDYDGEGGDEDDAVYHAGGGGYGYGYGSDHGDGDYGGHVLEYPHDYGEAFHDMHNQLHHQVLDHVVATFHYYDGDYHELHSVHHDEGAIRGGYGGYGYGGGDYAGHGYDGYGSDDHGYGDGGGPGDGHFGGYDIGYDHPHGDYGGGDVPCGDYGDIAHYHDYVSEHDHDQELFHDHHYGFDPDVWHPYHISPFEDHQHDWDGSYHGPDTGGWDLFEPERHDVFHPDPRWAAAYDHQQRLPAPY
eukprot:TRINITY_DN2851_c0_g1_i2.p1 TRINITY_DN2851_c0_g1~~TRINITY_DN2851_c0_g1_i2.p1  ORF type:complete len:746 (+),score=74.86 TRINITY_DN2851_c0_g1_i2:156-2393(+)